MSPVSSLLIKVWAVVSVASSLAQAAPSEPRTNNASCRFLPGDAGWPSVSTWSSLNDTVGGRLIAGSPLAHACYGSNANEAICASLQENWATLDPFLADPVNVQSMLFENTSCSPFYGPFSANAAYQNATCSMGNLASYAINITDAASAIAGVNFAREHNIRLSIKNTGHDFLGRNMGKGSLSLWTHYLKNASFFAYSSANYTGPAARIGAGLQVQELYEASAAAGYRVTGGGCPTVGAGGGWVQSGGHGPLSSLYGLGADQTLEFEVVTADGQHLTASPDENADLFWALSGGGPANFALVLSVTMKAHEDGPVAGATLSFTEDDSDKYWAAVEAWQRHLLVLDTIPGFQTMVGMAKGSFSLDYVTLPDGSVDDINAGLAPFYQELASLNISVTNDTRVHDSFWEHYQYFEGSTTWTRNDSVGNRLIPRDAVRNETTLAALTQVYKDILDYPNSYFYIIAYNVTHTVAGNSRGDNAVIEAWRDSLYLNNVIILNDPQATSEELGEYAQELNVWQENMRAVTPDSGAYMNEATYDYEYWKDDYYGETYDKLVEIKHKYDPGYVFWNRPGAGYDAYELKADGHLCKV
ncbi:hypothetical protein BD289DRAFT_373992 [Coniella lustricola]|uniref:FAD-binding PCMH-type domain-containing protein n=1 Tax=Coniella lustricola TaxID=2025994 RepID=A0A2T3A063_9PEZI|nr:hypothetical protein BD289DRAFT_373992 [Coniella lustricola]